jgi:hypothetical protein
MTKYTKTKRKVEKRTLRAMHKRRDRERERRIVYMGAF